MVTKMKDKRKEFSWLVHYKCNLFHNFLIKYLTVHELPRQHVLFNFSPVRSSLCVCLIFFYVN